MSATEENTEAILPCVLVTSCDSEFKEEALIKQILNSEILPQPTKQEGTVAWFPWTINNKYYTADVRLCAVPSTTQVTSEIAQSMQAFIAYFDSKVKDGMEKLNPWIPVVEDLAPEVLIIVCDRVSENGVTRHEAQQWCLAHAFELVELNPQDLPDEDDDFPESTGVKRIVQALNANVWSSVEMKDGHNQGFGLMSSLVASRHNNPRSCQDSPEMKDKASSLPHEQRKVHAEKVAKAFWMAIGGDEDEIDGLSSGEDS
ncbi:unnamed protein product [Menidia menidia]|uniref:(Atlantic silverside) hypothetical protein n=1 Tax=Menidia menidia TaxID=238744 RepID=A0A8S4BAB2_9TELE|nr:unnamed protein product [Menidia menidia]